MMEQNFNKMNGKVYLIIVSLFLGNWSLNAQQVKKVSMQKEETYQVVDEYADYESINAVNGNIDCLNTEPKYDFSLDNSLKVYNSGVYDMVLKLIDDKDNVATRMIYIKKGTTHEIKNIPQGIYTIKEAHGVDWRQKIEDGKCIGVFTQGAHYRIAETHPNFNVEKQYEKDKEITTIPYYEIELGVTQALVDDKKVDYKANYISVEDFNK